MTRDPRNEHEPAADLVDAALASLRLAYSEPELAQREAAQREAAQREAAWGRLQGRLHDPARVPFTDDVPAAPTLEINRASNASEHRHPARTIWRLGWSMAAALLLAVGGVAVWGATPVRHTVARGAAAAPLRLPDGSRVWVAAGSALSYDRRLAWPAPLRSAHRDVELQGTAFFDVAREGRAFRVRTSDATVQVLGTRFEVRAGTETFGSRVQVEEGRVAVTAGSARTELTAGQGTMVSAIGLTPQPTARQGVATWRTGGLAALDEPIGAVLEELSRRFAVEITADATVDTLATVSLFYPTAPSVDVVLGDVCAAQGLTFERTSRGYRVRGAVRAP